MTDYILLFVDKWYFVLKVLATIFFYLLPSFVEAGVAYLKYEADAPVVQESQLEFKLWLPETNQVIFDATQAFTCVVKLNTDFNELGSSDTPLSLDFTLKDFKIFLNSKDKKSVIDSTFPVNSSEEAQLKEIINYPMLLKFNKNLRIEEKGSDFSPMAKKFPLLQELNMKQFLEDFFQPIWILAEKELKVGTEIEVQSKNSCPTWPLVWKYQITKIDHKNVEATIKGNIKSEKLELSKVFSESSNTLDAYVGGTVVGNIRWNRYNALNYQLNLEGKYNGSVVNSSRESTPIVFTLRHKVTSR